MARRVRKRLESKFVFGKVVALFFLVALLMLLLTYVIHRLANRDDSYERDADQYESAG